MLEFLVVLALILGTALIPKSAWAEDPPEDDPEDDGDPDADEDDVRAQLKKLNAANARMRRESAEANRKLEELGSAKKILDDIKDSFEGGKAVPEEELPDPVDDREGFNTRYKADRENLRTETREEAKAEARAEARRAAQDEQYKTHVLSAASEFATQHPEFAGDVEGLTPEAHRYFINMIPAAQKAGLTNGPLSSPTARDMVNIAMSNPEFAAILSTKNANRVERRIVGATVPKTPTRPKGGRGSGTQAQTPESIAQEAKALEAAGDEDGALALLNRAPANIRRATLQQYALLP